MSLNIPGISSLLNLAGQGISLFNIGKGYQQTDAEKQQAQAMANQSALLQAVLDPNSTIYKNVNAGQQQQLNSQTQMGISNLLAANRKAQLMGRGSFFNPERQDEAVSQYLSKQSDANATTARSNALSQIVAAANGYGQSAQGYGGMIPTQRAAMNQNNAALPTALGGASSILNQFGSGGQMNNIMSLFGSGSGGGAGASWALPAGATDLGDAMPWLGA